MLIWAPIVLANDFNCIENNTIEINTDIRIELGDLIRGYVKNVFYEDQIIKFEIKCKNNRQIRITRINDIGNSNIKFKTEWKCGAYSGFEHNFKGDGVYSTENKKFYVTMKIKSVEVLSTALTGKYSFSPTLSVEFVNL
jgi:hypothetical protein